MQDLSTEVQKQRKDAAVSTEVQKQRRHAAVAIKATPAHWAPRRSTAAAGGGTCASQEISGTH
jgi:hypothetical protein